MQAVRLHGTNDLRLEDIAVPEPAPGEALIRVSHTSICQTDIEVWQHAMAFGGHGDPYVMGHEIGGVIESFGGESWGEREFGSDVDVGTRVVVNNTLTCGSCYWCVRGSQATCPTMQTAGLSANGGLAEYLTWPATHVVRLPDAIGDTEAPLIEPTTVAVHAARRSGIKPGDRVAVIGCGTVGLLTLQVAAASGATVYAVDVREQSLALARELGASQTIDASKFGVRETLLELTGGIGPDIVFEASGVGALPVQAIEAVRPAGTVVLVGIYADAAELNFRSIVLGEKTVIGTVAQAPGDMAAAVRMVAAGKVRLQPLVSAVVPLAEAIPAGFERMLAPEKDVFRIVVTPEMQA